MIKVNYDDATYELRNEPEEIKLSEFEKIYNILNTPDIGKLEQYSEVFKLMGLPEEVIDDLELHEFMDILRSFNGMSVGDMLPSKSFEIEGYEYVAYEGDEFKFKTKDVIEIERLAKIGVKNFPSMVMAILFKRSDLSKTEHYAKAHIEHKAKLFKEHLTADFVIPYIALVAKRTLKQLTPSEDESK